MEPTVAVNKIVSTFGVDESVANVLVEKAFDGSEVREDIELNTWLEERLIPNCVIIDEAGYSKMCIDALKILQYTAASDYGTSRQRDLGQIWGDMTRGYLGEFAFGKLLEQRWGVQVQLAHQRGKLEEFLPMDIHGVKGLEDSDFRTPGLKIGIKTTKINGIWFDIPGDQFRQSNIQVQVKVATGTDHLFAFFKQISVFKDKILQKGEDIGLLTKKESSNIYNHLPKFSPILAYVAGFIDTNEVYQPLDYAGRRGRKHFTIDSWNGPITEGDLEEIKHRENITGKVKFRGIEKFSHTSGYLFNTGSLKWKAEDWDSVASKL